jgi:hypothetical protein
MQIRYPAHLSKGIAFCLCVLKIRNKTLRVLALALDSGSALAAARWAGMTKTARSGRRGNVNSFQNNTIEQKIFL